MNSPKSDALYLTIHYQHPGSEAVLLGVALWVPALDSLDLYMREDLEFAAADDVEYLEALSDSFASLAKEQGAKFVFEWMASNLSNVVFVEGPNRTESLDPEQDVLALYERERGSEVSKNPKRLGPSSAGYQDSSPRAKSSN